MTNEPLNLTPFFKRASLALISLAVAVTGALAQKEPLTLDQIFADGGMTGRVPQDGKWSPDGTRFTYILRSGNGAEGDLWTLDPRTGNAAILVPNSVLAHLNPSIDRAITNEREKERLTRYAVAGYLWRPDSKALLFVSAGHLYLYDLATKSAQSVLPEQADLTDPKFSPDGRWISFVKGHDLWITPAAGGSATRLTRGGSANLLNGELDWVYPEEFDVRTGYCWSPDSRRLAFLQLDQTGVGEAPIVDFTTMPQATVEMQKYPKAGQRNPAPQVGSVDLNGKISWFDQTDEYIPRMQWADSNTLSVQLLNRRQNELRLVLWHVDAGNATVVLKERDPKWVNVNDELHFFGKDEILWASERDGFNHLYVYNRDGRELTRLTRGAWEVTSVEEVDDATGWIYFTATEKSPIERHGYRVQRDGSGMQRLTAGGRTHRLILAPSASDYIDVSSSFLSPPQYAVVSTQTGAERPRPVGGLSGQTVSPKVFFQSLQVDKFDLTAPEVVELKGPEGRPVRLMLLKPPDVTLGRKYPVVVYLYGGPHAPVIHNSWGGERFLWHQWMVGHGYVVAYLDDHLSAIPGHKYESDVYRNFGFAQIEDHRAAVNYLKSLPFVDGGRIGLWGWSGGGYTTCFDLFNAGDLFKVGVAVAPLTDFRDYDTIWTERYMGLPTNNPAEYEKSSTISHASKLSGNLLLIHGTSDDNVHMQNSIQLAKKLIDSGKTFDIFLYPGKTHAIAGSSTRRHLYGKIADYFDEHLKR